MTYDKVPGLYSEESWQEGLLEHLRGLQGGLGAEGGHGKAHSDGQIRVFWFGGL